MQETSALNDFTLQLISQLHKDYLLLNRICYKSKNVFKRQKQFQYVRMLKTKLKRMFNIPSKPIYQILKEWIKDEVIFNEKQKELINLLLKLSQMLKEMMKLKLYLSYSLVMIGITSRIYFILKYIENNKCNLINE